MSQSDMSKVSGPEFVAQLVKAQGAYLPALGKDGKVLVRVGWTPTPEQLRAADQAGFRVLAADAGIGRYYNLPGETLPD